MLDHQNSVSIDTRQLSWEFIFIYSNPEKKKKTTQKISTQGLIFLMMNKFLKSIFIEKFA